MKRSVQKGPVIFEHVQKWEKDFFVHFFDASYYVQNGIPLGTAEFDRKNSTIKSIFYFGTRTEMTGPFGTPQKGAVKWENTATQ